MNECTCAILLAILAGTLTATASAQDVADRIWTGGSILTMNDAEPRAEALAVRSGDVLSVGTTDEILKHRGDRTEMIDLDGRTIVPGFVDAHGHVFGIGLQALSANLLPAPDGEGNDIPSLQRIVRQWIDAHPERVEAANVILGFGYDDSQLAELRHPTKDELDEISTEIPVYFIHQSGHIGVANSKALEIAGLTAETPEMPGGVIRREEGTNIPNGVLEETPHFAAIPLILQNVDAKGASDIFRAGVELAASFGYTTAEEGRSQPGLVELMKAVAESAGGLPIDVVTYADVLIDRDYVTANVSSNYVNGFRVAGGKLTIDGSPQGFTAWRDRPYYAPPEGYRADYVGFPAAMADQVFDALDWAYANDIQLLVHSNGEASTDLLLAAVETAERAHGNDDRRPVLIHGQFLREDQVDKMKGLKLFPSLFPMHTFYWGDWHRDRTVGPVNAENISPTGWFMDRGMKFSSHHDAPVALPNSMRVLDATVTRRSRSGDIIGPRHRVDVMTALKAMTIWPAYQHFEEDKKGSIEAGKLADLVILSDDPTSVDPETLDQLVVLETIKEGETIYKKSDGQ